MAVSYKVLAQGQLPSSIGTLYTVPALTEAIIKSIRIVNNDGSSRTFSLNVNGTAAANRITGTITLNPEDTYVIEKLTLGAAETLRGVASVATQLTYTVFGAEVS